MEQPHLDIMTVEDVAKYLKLKPQTVYKWAQTGQIPAAKLGKEWRFRRSIIDEWIDTSIALSKGGFNLMVTKSKLELKKNAFDENSLNPLIDSIYDNEI